MNRDRLAESQRLAVNRAVKKGQKVFLRAKLDTNDVTVLIPVYKAKKADLPSDPPGYIRVLIVDETNTSTWIMTTPLSIRFGT